MGKMVIQLFTILLIISSIGFAASPVALQHVSFDDHFGAATHIDGTGSIQFIDGPIGKAVEFANPTTASSGDHLELPNIMADQGTVAMWLNIDQYYDYQNVWDCGANGWTWEMYSNASGMFYTKVSGWPGCMISSGTDFSLNNWFHYAWTWQRNVDDAVLCKLYVNGVLVSEDSTTQTWSDSGAKFNLGGGNSGQYKYNGKMDEFYIFDSLMDAADIAAFIADSNDGHFATDPYPHVAMTVQTTDVTLAWTAPTGVASPAYDVYIKEGDSDFTGVTPFSTTLTEQAITVTHGKTYYWKVNVTDGATVYEGITWQFEANFSSDDPVAILHVPFEDDDYSGVTYLDDQGGEEGTITITAGGQVGNYGLFDNPNAGQQGDSFACPHPGDSGSIAMWAKLDPTALSVYPVLWDSSVSGNDWKCYVNSSHDLYARLASSQWAPNVYDANDLSEWFHCVWTWDAAGGSVAETKLYIDGSQVSATQQNFDAHDSMLRIGGGFSWYPKFDGGMDEVYVFDRALTADQITVLLADSIAGVLATNPKPAVCSTVESADVTLSWTAPANVTSPTYNVYVAVDGPAFVGQTPISTTTTSTDITVEHGKTYYWKVEVVDGVSSYESVVWTFEVVLGQDAPVAMVHVPFEDGDFDGVTYLDDQGGMTGDIQITSGGQVGSYGNFVNPYGNAGGEPDGDSFAGQHPGDRGSIAMWVKCDPASLDYYPVFWDSSVAGNDWKCWVYSNQSITARLAASHWAPNSYVSSDLSQWFHYVWTWDKIGSSAATKLYIDGVEVSNKTQNFDAHDDVIRIGGGGKWYPKFAGGMDEVYIFDRALTADQVTALLADTNAGVLATDPKPAAGVVSAYDALQKPLSWAAPTAVVSPTYNVYFSDDPTLPPLSSQIASGISSNSIAMPATCVEGQRYYWRVDVIDGATTHTGIVWSYEFEYLDSDLDQNSYVNLGDFAKVAADWGQSNMTDGQSILVDDFEGYATQQEMEANWQVVPDNYYTAYNEGIAAISLTSGQAYTGNGALRLDYDFTNGWIDWAIGEFMHVFDTPKNLGGYQFEMWMNCDATNSHEQYFYVKLFRGGVGCGGPGGDGADFRVSPEVYALKDLSADSNPVTTDQATGWQKVSVALDDLGTDLTDIRGFEIGASTQPFADSQYGCDFGTGSIHFDDIQFTFVPVCTGPLEGDINGDCMVDIEDMAQLSSDWLD